MRRAPHCCHVSPGSLSWAEANRAARRGREASRNFIPSGRCAETLGTFYLTP
jgi:hypothetical protein